jgi:hypothetical protein
MKCSPVIWRKFNATEKELWSYWFNLLKGEENFHIDLTGKKKKEQREVTAHNMACQIVWALARVLPEKKPKKATHKKRL